MRLIGVNRRHATMRHNVIQRMQGALFCFDRTSEEALLLILPISRTTTESLMRLGRTGSIGLPVDRRDLCRWLSAWRSWREGLKRSWARVFIGP